MCANTPLKKQNFIHQSYSYLFSYLEWFHFFFFPPQCTKLDSAFPELLGRGRLVPSGLPALPRAVALPRASVGWAHTTVHACTHSVIQLDTPYRRQQVHQEITRPVRRGQQRARGLPVTRAVRHSGGELSGKFYSFRVRTWRWMDNFTCWRKS